MTKENPLFKSDNRNEMFQEVVEDMLKTPPLSARLIKLTEIVTNEAVESIKKKIEEKINTQT